MTPWITPADVEPLVQTDLAGDDWVDALIPHAQGLIEAEIGAQDPAALPAGLTAVTAQIVARLWRAGQAARVNPAGHQMEVLGPHTFQAGNISAGWGLTDREKETLGRFRHVLWVLPTHRADGLERPPGLVADTAGGDAVLWTDPADMPVTP